MTKPTPSSFLPPPYTVSPTFRCSVVLVWTYCLLIIPFSFANAQQDTIMDEAGDELYIYDPNYEKILGEQAPYQIKVNEHGLKGMYDFSTKTWSIAPIYDHIGWSPSFGPQTPDELKRDRNFVILSKGDLRGVYHKNGTPIFPVQFLRTINVDSLPRRGNLWILKDQNKRFGLISVQQDTLFPLENEYISFNNRTGLYRAERYGKVQTINAAGEIVKPWDWYYPSIEIEDRVFHPAKHNGLFGVYNKEEELVLPFAYSFVRHIIKGYFAVKHPAEGIGLFDIHFKPVIPCQYASLEALNPWQINMARHHDPDAPHLLVQQSADSLYSFINLEGKLLSPPVFHQPKQMKVIHGIVFDYLGKDQIAVRNRSGDSLFDEVFSKVDPVRSANSTVARRILERGRTYLALFNQEKKAALLDLQTLSTVTPFAYDGFTAPVSYKEDEPIRLITGHKGQLLYLLRLDGTLLSELGFKKVQVRYNGYASNRPVLLRYPEAEAVMERPDGELYVLIDNAIKKVELKDK
ncbi:MAG: WG repeat-containing protein [Saprospiraceae bacterium]|nr:WG repeat-containing protein [Saprospiraceae bacterium]